jgi:hypothetical protein
MRHFCFVSTIGLVICLMIGPGVSAGPATGGQKSIRQWVVCDGRADDTAGTAKAFAAARHGAFTLVVDCPVRLHIGMDIGRTIFIDDGTTVEFTGDGKFTIDNVFHPGFVIANSSDITLTNWNVQYVGGLPVDPDTGGFEQNGQFIAHNGRYQVPAAFNDNQLTPWLTKNRGIVFDQSQGHVTSEWVGPTNTSSIFFIAGDVSRVRVTGLKLYVPPNTGAEHFIPMAFSLSRNYRSNQTVTKNTPLTAQYVAVPHDVHFSDVDLDGTYMGWQGTLQDASFERIRSRRYGDLQDSGGSAIGGIGKWFAPPHLFYLSYAKKLDPMLFNRHILIHDVIDSGPRIGEARDKGGSDSISGNALSLKIGGVDCQVDEYQTDRPDGFLDLLSSDGMTISNVKATYDSTFLHDLYPGLRFPDPPYKNVRIENVLLIDVAPRTTRPPIGNAVHPFNESIVLRNVKVRLNRWMGSGPLRPTIIGQGNEVSIDYSTGSPP